MVCGKRSRHLSFLEVVLSHDNKHRNSKQRFRHIFRSFTVQTLRSVRRRQTFNRIAKQRQRYGHCTRQFSAEIQNYFVERQIHGRGIKCRQMWGEKSVRRDQLKDQEWNADNIKIGLTDIQCHTLPVFVFCLYFTLQKVRGLIYLLHPSNCSVMMVPVKRYPTLLEDI